ncbi:MAG: Shikimate kinase 1 [Opitutia bacterium UBA7350]|nr:MAG: Shikimate kinase 1 [Opitutae bacterium UBA7350]
MNDKSKNLYLVGFMGVGKSVIGRQVAGKLGLQFIDSDNAIEKAKGCRISDIFETEGEASFRQYERRFVESGHPSSGCVIACGGGLVVQAGIAEILRARGVVISLFASIETIMERTSRNDKRPLLNVENRESRIRDLLKEREPAYLAAGIAISTQGRSAAEVVEHIIRVYESHSA